MRTFFIFSLIFYLLEVLSAKPLSLVAGQTRETGEAEYEGNEETAAEDYQQDSDQDSSVDTQKQSSLQEGANNNGRREAVQDNSRLPDLNNPYKQHNNNLQRGHLNNFDNFPEISGISRDARNDKTSSTNVDSNGKLNGRYRQPDTYAENNEQEARQHFNENAFKMNHAQNLGFDNNINKRAMLPPGASDEGDLLFENNRDQLNKLDKSGYAREGESGLQPRFFKHQTYNIPGESKETTDFKRYDKWRLNRNRRQTPKNYLKTNDEVNESTPAVDSKELDLVNEDEESAIKRHVKKLSGPELEELFNTLSDDKRNLLKKIIDNDSDNDDTVSKREITKKAGAVEQNSYIENGQLDSSKIQGVSSNVEESNTETSLSHETTETSKKSVSATELGEIMPSKSSGGCDKSENKLDLANPNEDLKEVKSEGNLDLESKKSDTDVDLESNSQIMSKNENKREANINEMTNLEKSDDTQIVDRDYSLKDFQGSMNNQDMFLQDDELTDLINDETERQTSHKNGLKREAPQDESVDLAESIKSLEESFPNPKSYDESNPFYGSDMAPLVRVKRKDADSAIMKRSASVIADSNVPYFPNKGENDDEDNDEGSEFDEDGFYDRTSNFARNNDNKPFDIPCAKEDDRVFNQKSGHTYGGDNLESDTANLGSDTDNAMTGAEGINDNLMYSALRDRRTSEENDNNKILDDKVKDISPERRLRSTPLMDNQAKTVSETNINVPVPGYQENDAFGPLPRSYEGDLGRYKRIRRVKQMPMFQDNLTQTE